MKRLVLHLLYLCLALSAGAARLALMIGVGNYPEGSGWTKIHSANDIALLKPVYEQQGFVVDTLLDENATHQGIVDALNSLIEQAREDDEIIIHFSCHGQQMESRSKKERDGLDEAMVPYDALRRSSRSYKGQNHLRDKELDTYLKRLRKKMGENGKLLVVLDACHSGDATRGLFDDDCNEPFIGPVRGVSDVFCKNPPYNKPVKRLKRIFSKLPRIKGFAPMVAICACQPYQRSFEYYDYKTDKTYGSLSFLVWLELQKMGDIDFVQLGHGVVNNKDYTMRIYQEPYLLEE